MTSRSIGDLATVDLPRLSWWFGGPLVARRAHERCIERGASAVSVGTGARVQRAPVGGGTASCRHIVRAVPIGISR